MGLPNRLEIHGSAPALELEIVEDSGFLSAIMEHSADGIYFKNPESRLIEIGRARAELLRFADPSDAAGKTDHDLCGLIRGRDSCWRIQ